MQGRKMMTCTCWEKNGSLSGKGSEGDDIKLLEEG